MSESIDTRVALLEQIARSTEKALQLIREEATANRAELLGEIRGLRTDQRSDFRMLLTLGMSGFGFMAVLMLALLGVVAHGFHWI